MELLFWLLGFFAKPMVVFVFLLVIIVMLDAAAKSSTQEKDNLYRKKNGVEETKLDKKGLKGGAAKKSEKKKRVEFVDDAVGRKASDVEVSEKLIEDVENISEKVGFFANSSEGRLIVDRGEDSKIVEDVDQDDVVVVRKVYHLHGSDELIEVFELSDDMSEKVGFLDSSLEEGLGVSVMEVRQYEAGGVDKESEVMVCGEKSVGGFSDVNMMKDVTSAHGSTSVGLQVEALYGKVAREKNEVGGIGDNCGVIGGLSVTGGLEGSVVDQGIEIDAAGAQDGLISMNDIVRVEECRDATGERVANNAENSEKALEMKALDRENGLKFMNDGAVIDESDAAAGGRIANKAKLLEEALEMQVVHDEDGMVLTNDDVVTDKRDSVVGKRVAHNKEGLEEGLDRDTLDGLNGITINGVVSIDESDAKSGESFSGKAVLSEEDLVRDTAEEKSEDTAGDLGKICGGEEDNSIPLADGMENLVVEEVINCEQACAKSNVELVNDNAACPLIEADGVETGGNGEEEGILQDKGDDDNGDNDVDDDDDDDWEGVERSELEKVFAEAVNYVEYGWKTKDDRSASLRRDVQMLLYGLHKLAVEGPCHLPQPMALKITARAKWNAWQSLGSMSPEVAMEEYIKILSDTDPGWMQHSTTGSSCMETKFSNVLTWRPPAHPTDFELQEDHTHDSLETGVELEGGPDNKLTSHKDPQANFKFGRNPEMSSVLDDNSLIEQTP